MLSLKEGVRIHGLRPEMVLAARIVEGCFEVFGLHTVLTAAIDGKHSRGSLHYVGAALDFRTRHVPPENLQPLFGAIVDRLGPDFDVVLESDHVHIEFQPKEAY